MIDVLMVRMLAIMYRLRWASAGKVWLKMYWCTRRDQKYHVTIFEGRLTRPLLDWRTKILAGAPTNFNRFLHLTA